MVRSTYIALCFILLMQCQSDKKQIPPADIVGEWESISNKQLPVSYLGKGIRTSMFGPADGRKLVFHADSTVETREIPFDKLDWFEILDYKVPFEIHDDTLLFFKLGFTGWNTPPTKKQSGRVRIQSVNHDTLTFILNDNERALYQRVKPISDTLPVFDAIIVSTSGCYGKCPINNTLIKADGSILFFGERYVDNIGFYRSRVNSKEYLTIQNLFLQADIKNIATDFEDDYADLEQVTITFVKDGRIYKTIRDYGGKGPAALLWAYVRLRHLHNFIELEKIPALINPLREQLSLNGFSNKNRVCPLSKSEAFLLWSYLLEGKTSKVAAQPRFKVEFDTNFAWEPRNDQPDTITDITTDGQRYTFLDGKKTITIDIGFNFFDRNYTMKSFITQAQYMNPESLPSDE